MSSFVKISSPDDLKDIISNQAEDMDVGEGLRDSTRKLKKEVLKKKIQKETKDSKFEQQLIEQRRYNEIAKKLKRGALIYESDQDVDRVKMMIEQSVLLHLRPVIDQIYSSVVEQMEHQELSGSGFQPNHWGEKDDPLAQENFDAYRHKTKDDYQSFFTEDDVAQINRQRDIGYVHHLMAIGETERAEIEAVRLNVNLSRPRRPRSGSGLPAPLYVEYEKPMAHYNGGKYKITKDGMFGELRIDVDKLENNLKLEAFKGNKKVMSRKVDQDTFDILTKRYNSKKQYSQKAVETLNKLVELSDISPYKLQNKAKLVNSEKLSGSDGKIMLASPDELISKFGVLVKKKKKTDNDKNMISEIADKLLELGIISDGEYQKIFTMYID